MTGAEALMEEGVRRVHSRVRQEILTHQLRVKFESIPQGIIGRIEATEYVEQLDAWLRAVVHAEDLASMGIPLAESEGTTSPVHSISGRP
jgi:hypothetical protein